MNFTGSEIVAMVLGLAGSAGGLITLGTAWLKRGDKKLDDAAEIRQELIAQNKALLDRIDKERGHTDAVVDRQDKQIAALEAELDVWKDKYTTLRESNVTLRAENVAQAQKIVTMQYEIDSLKAQVNALQAKKVKS